MKTKTTTPTPTPPTSMIKRATTALAALALGAAAATAQNEYRTLPQALDRIDHLEAALDEIAGFSSDAEANALDMLDTMNQAHLYRARAIAYSAARMARDPASASRQVEIDSRFVGVMDALVATTYRHLDEGGLWMKPSGAVSQTLETMARSMVATMETISYGIPQEVIDGIAQLESAEPAVLD